jgi:hypothetical protein
MLANPSIAVRSTGLANFSKPGLCAAIAGAETRTSNAAGRPFASSEARSSAMPAGRQKSCRMSSSRVQMTLTVVPGIAFAIVAA